MKNILFTTVAAAGLAFGASAQAATVSIDTFGDDQGRVEASSGGTTVDAKATANAIGGTRTISVTNTGGPLITAGSSIAAGEGFFSFSNDTLTLGTATVSYAAGGVDLTDGGMNDSFLIDVLSIDLGMTVTLEIDGHTEMVSINSDGDILFDLANFANAANANSIAVTFDSNGIEAVDAAVDFIGAVPSIPLPAGGLLLLSGLVGFAALRRKAA